MAKKKELRGYCGYDCTDCGARSKDPEVRRKVVDGWRRLFGLKMYTVENVRCVGCRNAGKVADVECRARPCARRKGHEYCMCCADFPCDKLKLIIPRAFFATEEEYNLCVKQFDVKDDMTSILVKAGKAPAWAKKKGRGKK